jgi:hypothetical protein
MYAVLSQCADERAEAREVGPARIDERAVDRIRPAGDRPVHGGVVALVLVMDAAHDGQLVGQLRHPRQQLREADARHVGGNRLEGAADVVARVGFRIPEVDVAGAAAVVDEDDGLGFSLAASSSRAEGVGPTEIAPEGGQSTERARAKEVATFHSTP